jgi:hypothetical protein
MEEVNIDDFAIYFNLLKLMILMIYETIPENYLRDRGVFPSCPRASSHRPRASGDPDKK